MAVSAHTWAVGEIVTAANMNTYLRDNMSGLQSNKAVIKSGVYTGDGTTGQAITGIGFEPIWITIVRSLADAAATVTHFTTSTMVDNDAQGLCVTHASATLTMQDAQIVSLDSDGFTVSDGNADLNPNTNGAGYEYICIGQE